jgi:hypothetical protein
MHQMMKAYRSQARQQRNIGPTVGPAHDQASTPIQHTRTFLENPLRAGKVFKHVLATNQINTVGAQWESLGIGTNPQPAWILLQILVRDVQIEYLDPA